MCAEHWKLLYSARDISEDFVKDSESKICRVEVGLAGTGSPGGKSLKLGPVREGER